MKYWLIDDGGWALIVLGAFVVGMLWLGYSQEAACNDKGGIIVRGTFTAACVKAETL